VSALRVSRPGHATVHIDQGPACGRVSFTRGPVAPIGGLLVVAPSERSVRTEQARRYRAQAAKPTCGKWMPIIKESCGRATGHRHSCRSAVVMADEAKRRWSGGDGVRVSR
jgi:hypothetical protein